MPYFTNATTKQVGIFNFLFFLNSLCVRSNVTTVHVDHCLDHQVGMPFDVSRIRRATESYLERIFPDWGVPESFVAGPGRDIVVGIVPFVFYVLGLACVVVSWTGHFLYLAAISNSGASTAPSFVSSHLGLTNNNRATARLRLVVVTLQFVAVVCHLVATSTANDRASAARNQLNPAASSTNILGPSFFAVAWCATASQFLGAFAYLAADRVRRDLVRMDRWLAETAFGVGVAAETGSAAGLPGESVGRSGPPGGGGGPRGAVGGAAQGGPGTGGGMRRSTVSAAGEYLPPYSRVDPLGRPPSIGRPPLGHHGQQHVRYGSTSTTRSGSGCGSSMGHVPTSSRPAATGNDERHYYYHNNHPNVYCCHHYHGMHRHESGSTSEDVSPTTVPGARGEAESEISSGRPSDGNFNDIRPDSGRQQGKNIAEEETTVSNLAKDVQ